eukprot:CAMPEP_0116115960 /NCGR_PEP_ID=MMETSP0329-20121206/783_1 /TAXON_ID=697910 /ORGANISM="Pseudo-nitzschia arenysensis, Strain B593" /LENGTH=544 /DNA_ID=CAMNT_0003609423 /DNA_START=17 /DNA_END=1651 /DNA_ORIENTATION=-
MSRRMIKSDSEDSEVSRSASAGARGNWSRSGSSIAMSSRDLSSRNGSGSQIKPNAGRKDMRSFSFSDKNLRAAGQQRIFDLGNCLENSEEEEDGHDIEQPKPSNGVGMKSLNETEMKSLLQSSESLARETAESRTCCLFFYDGISAILVIWKYLITVESVVSTLLSTVTTWVLYTYHADWEARGDGEKPSKYSSMSFLILSFFLVMPITTLLRITYKRREENLAHISKLKAVAMALYQCHAIWSWPGADEKQPLNRLEHSDEYLQVLIDFADTITRFLTLPMTGYPRHREIGRGRREEELTMTAAYSLFETAVSEYATKLVMLTEAMKDAGFSPSEASRTRQWERMLVECAEYLREGKLYRTPQSMNALITFFSVFGPAFYAPSFAQAGHEFGSVWFGMIYAAIISLSLTALYEAVKLMEDPFVCYITIDGIDVYEELSIVFYMQLLRARKTIFPNAAPFGTSPSKWVTNTGPGRRQRRSSVSTSRRCSTRFSSSNSLTINNILCQSTSSTIKRRSNTQQTLTDDLESGIAKSSEEEEEVVFSK